MIKSKLSLSVVQFRPAFGDKEKNLNTIIGIINISEADIIVFPELATTGYFFQSREEVSRGAETKYGNTINKIQELASSLNKVIVIGFTEAENGKLYNSAAIVFPEPEMTSVYRKTHLFYKEKLCFDAGDTGFSVIYYPEKDINIGTMICYDWRFPESARTLALKGADLIVCPSNLITNFWHKVMPARAFENKVYLAVANRIGKESRNGEEVAFNGQSVIYDYNGEALAQAERTGEAVLSAEIEPELTRDKSFNEFNDIFKDRRLEMYK